MRKLSPGIVAGAAAGCALGLLHVVVETAAITLLYAGYLLPPATFFNVRMYDAFLKLYTWVAGRVGLPLPLETFVAQGMAAKLRVAGELLWVNVAVGLVVGAILGAAFAALRRGAVDRRGVATRVVLAAAVLGVVAHVWDWADGLYIPVDPTWTELARNLARNFVFDGTLLALAVLGVAASAALVAVRRVEARSLVAGAAAAAVAGAAWATLQERAADAHAAVPAPPASAAAAGAPIAPGYNVILVSIDSLRADHLGAYGYAKPTSPAMDALAREGVLFRHTSSTTSWTLPGHMSMLSGRSLLGHGVVTDDRKLTDDVPMLAESMSAAGMKTHAIVSAPYVEARYGFGRGFDTYDDRTISFATHGESYKQVTAPLVVQTAEQWLEANGKQPFFLFLHFWDVHYDYAPGPPYDTMFDPDYDGDVTGENFYFNPAVNRRMDPRDLEHVLALYDGEIRLVDDHIAKLRAALDRLGIGERTILLVTADHGDEFFEHGRKGHHRTLYEEVVHVPMILHVPGVRPERSVVGMQTSIIDVMPTLLGLLGLSVPPGVEGADLSRVAFRGHDEWERPILAELYRKDALNVQTALRRGSHKVIHHFNRRIVESYDLASDPGEQRSLAGDAPFGPALVGEMGDLLNVLWSVYEGRIVRGGVNTLAMDAETEERLRALGYIQ